MPHASWCTRNAKPSAWLRFRYGVFAVDAMKRARPCAACDRLAKDSDWAAFDNGAAIRRAIRLARADGVVDMVGIAVARVLSAMPANAPVTLRAEDVAALTAGRAEYSKDFD